MIAQGIEINPWLVISSRRAATGVGPGEASFAWANMWNSGEQVRLADIVVLYGPGGDDGVMEQYGEFLERHAKPGATVASFYFAIPGWRGRLTSEALGWFRYEVPRKA